MRHSQRGYTLAEALISGLIIVTLTSIAIPCHSWIQQQRLKSSKSQLQQLTLHARSYALQNNERVTLCHLAIDQRCSNLWSPQLSLFSDPNGNRRLDHDERLITFSNLGAVSLQWRGMAPANSLHFNGSGHTFVSNGTFSLCLPGQETLYKLVLNRQGRLRTETQHTGCNAD